MDIGFAMFSFLDTKNKQIYRYPGFVSLVQINKQGDYNEVGETITLKATLKNPDTPTGFKLHKGDSEDTISNTPTPTKNGDVSV